MKCKDCPRSNEPDWRADISGDYVYCKYRKLYVHKEASCSYGCLVSACKKWKAKAEKLENKCLDCRVDLKTLESTSITLEAKVSK